MNRCRLCDVDLDTVNVIYHYSRFHDSKPTYDELDAEVRALQLMIFNSNVALARAEKIITQLRADYADLAVSTRVWVR
jgi:hypothetical protein